MEKRTPHTRLSQVKKLVNAGQVRTTRSALLNADELGWILMVCVMLSLDYQRATFIKA